MARIELATARQQDCAITIEILIILQMSITIQAFSSLDARPDHQPSQQLTRCTNRAQLKKRKPEVSMQHVGSNPLSALGMIFPHNCTTR